MLKNKLRFHRWLSPTICCCTDERLTDSSRIRLSIGRTLPRFFGYFIALIALIAFGIAFPSAAIAVEQYSPEHPVVQKMVDAGIRFLASREKDLEGDSWTGLNVLRAYTILEASREGKNDDHPLVLTEIEKAKRYTSDLGNPKSRMIQDEKVIYISSVVAQFLMAMDSVKYRANIETVRDFLIGAQYPSGGFGYLSRRGSAIEGDVSQTQYAALALWKMKQAGINVSPSVFDKMFDWLKRVQSGNKGGWTYQFPGDPETTQAMLVAGLSGALIAADGLELIRGTGAKLAMTDDQEDDGVPGAFRRINSDIGSKEKGAASAKKGRSEIEEVLKNARRWQAANKYQRSGAAWHYYWMYSQERCESFAEILVGRNAESPVWYNEGVLSLKKDQDANGGWGEKDQDPAGPDANTCFAILFLIRDSKQAIGDLKTADSVGGYGLNNVAEVGLVDGKLVDKSQVTSIEDAIKLLEGNQEGSIEDKLLADRMSLDVDPKKKKEQLNRFARLLRSPDARARRVAAKLLGRGDDLDFVPDLIFALSEGEQDGTVLRLAENSLRILSRQLTTYILPREGPVTSSDRVKSERYWQIWYLSIRPDYVFINQ